MRKDGLANGLPSLVPMLNMRLAKPRILVDIVRLEELREIELRRGRIIVGATVRQAELQEWPTLDCELKGRGLLPAPTRLPRSPVSARKQRRRNLSANALVVLSGGVSLFSVSAVLAAWLMYICIGRES